MLISNFLTAGDHLVDIRGERKTDNAGAPWLHRRMIDGSIGIVGLNEQERGIGDAEHNEVFEREFRGQIASRFGRKSR
jgi:hypothetical protein